MYNDNFLEIVKDILRRLRVLEQNQKFIMPARASDPTDGTLGETYFNTSSNVVRIYNGSSWQNV